MTPERKAELEAAAEYGRRMGEQTAAVLRRELEKRDEMMELLHGLQTSFAPAEPSAEQNQVTLEASRDRMKAAVLAHRQAAAVIMGHPPRDPSQDDPGRLRLVAIDGARVDQRSPFDFG